MLQEKRKQTYFRSRQKVRFKKIRKKTLSRSREKDSGKGDKNQEKSDKNQEKRRKDVKNANKNEKISLKVCTYIQFGLIPRIDNWQETILSGWK